MPLYTEPYDTADYLTDDESIYYYLTEELNGNELFYMAKALKTVARALGGIPQLSLRTGVSEEELITASDTEHLNEALIVKVLRCVSEKFSASIAA
jgi:probable addiction module antidote protein